MTDFIFFGLPVLLLVVTAGITPRVSRPHRREIEASGMANIYGEKTRRVSLGRIFLGIPAFSRGG